MSDQNDLIAVESKDINEVDERVFQEEEIDLFLSCSELPLEKVLSGSLTARTSAGTDSIDDDSLTPGKPSRGKFSLLVLEKVTFARLQFQPEHLKVLVAAKVFGLQQKRTKKVN